MGIEDLDSAIERSYAAVAAILGGDPKPAEQTWCKLLA
jgi:hypothetical protein